MEKEIELQEIRGFIKRRKKVFITTFSLLFIVGVVIALSLTPIYTSQAVIRIEGQQIPENFVRPTIKEYAEERIEKISQQVMTRSKLIEIMDRFDLYPENRDENSATELLKKMRKDIKLETIEAKMQNKAVTVAFSLSYAGKDPVKVQKVAKRLSKLYLEEDIRAREKFISGTTDFLEEELQRLREEISAHEKIISDFKQNHFRELPTDSGYNLQAMARLEREFNNKETQLLLLQEKKVLLQSKLANIEPLTPIVIDGQDMAINPAERLKRLRLELTSMRSIYSEKHPDIKKKKKEIAKLEGQVQESDDSVAKIKMLQQLKIELSIAKARKGIKHPDVKAIQKKINALKKETDNLVTAGAMIKISEEKPDNPVYINLKTQLETIEMEIQSIQKNRLELQTEIDKYLRRIEIVPVVEKELNALERDHENLRRKYLEISQKLMNSKLIQKMEDKQKGDRFSITSPAYLPDKPNLPNRLLIIAISFVLAFGIGAALVAFQEWADDSIKTSNQLKELTKIPVFSTFSYIETDEEKRRRRVKNLLWAGAAISCVVIALLIINLFVIKLDQAWKVVFERIMMIA